MPEWVQVLIRTIDSTPTGFVLAVVIALCFLMVSDDVCRVVYHALRRRCSAPNSRPLSKERRDAIARRLQRDAAAAAGQPALAAPGTARRAARVLDLRPAGDARGPALDAACGVSVHATRRPGEGMESLAAAPRRAARPAEGHV